MAKSPEQNVKEVEKDVQNSNTEKTSQNLPNITASSTSAQKRRQDVANFSEERPKLSMQTQAPIPTLDAVQQVDNKIR